MKDLFLYTALAATLVGATPASALGIAMDIPRLDFPAPQPEASRDCRARTFASPTCTNTQKRQQPLDKSRADKR